MNTSLLFKQSYLLAILLSTSLISLGQYCIPGANCTFGDAVVEFGIGPFYNSSGCGSDAGTPGYSDFTDLPNLTLAQGVTYDGSFRSDFASQQFSIWIDSDNSESFETEELILTDLAVGTELIVSPVTIPITIPIGQYRLRIMSTYAAMSSTDACVINSIYGEAEDYTVTISEPPSCINVSALNLDGVSATAATISWSDPGTATAWDIEFGPAGFEPTGMPSAGMDDIDNPFTIEMLSPVTEYDVYIRADCGQDNMTDVSLWTSPFTFVTACGAVVPDYYENLDNGLGNCWSTYGGGDLTTGPLEEGFSNWFDNGFAGIPNVFSGSQGISMFGADVNNWLVTPDFDLSDGPFQTEFDISMTAGGFGLPLTLAPDDEFFFLISTDFGISWDTLGYWNESNGVEPLGEHYSYDLSAYAGELARFAFYSTNGTNDDFTFYQVYVDNFRVQGIGAPLLVNIDLVVEPNCFQFGGNPLADVIISVSGGAAPYTFEWSDGTETEDLLDAEPGIVTVTVTDSEGQTFTSDEISVPGTPVLTVQALITDETEPGAADGTIEITEVEGGVPPYNFIWNNGATTGTIEGLIDAFWCVLISDANGCSTDTCLEVLEGIPSGVLDSENIISMNIFPNPAINGIVNIRAEFEKDADWQMEIIDMMGRTIFTRSYPNAMYIRESIDLSSTSSGVYTIRLVDLSSGRANNYLISR